MHIFDQFFAEYNQSAAQILLTGDDVEDAGRAEHLRRTFSALLEMGVIPVVNENDSVSSAEIETGSHKVLGDNDTLSAVVAKLCRADLLVLFSDIDGLFDSNPRENPGAQLLHRVEEPRFWRWQGAPVPGEAQAAWPPSFPPPGLPWKRDAIW